MIVPFINLQYYHMFYVKEMCFDFAGQLGTCFRTVWHGHNDAGNQGKQNSTLIDNMQEFAYNGVIDSVIY